MKAYLNSFASGKGDCIFLRLINGDEKYSMMVDCGEFNQAIENFVQQTLIKHIDLLIVTHIDCDHVDGVSEMLKKIPDITIGKIFYNCYQQMSGVKPLVMNDTVNSDIDKLRSNLPSRALSSDRGKINMEAASVLAAQLIENTDWNKAWVKEYIHAGTQDYLLGDNFGRLVFFAPTLDKIQALDKSFAREYMRLTTHQLISDPFSGKETLYELVTKLVAMKNKDQELKKNKKIGLIFDKYNEDAWEAAKKFKSLPITSENSASLAFMWECNDKRILFMGDAEPDIVVKSLNDNPNIKTPLEFNAIKVAHHGSKHSTSNELMNIVDSKDYYVTGGNKTNKPSLEALAKILIRDDDKIRTIHYTNKNNQIMIDLQKEKFHNIRSKYNFQITDNNEQEF